MCLEPASFRNVEYHNPIGYEIGSAVNDGDPLIVERYHSVIRLVDSHGVKIINTEDR